MPRIPIAIRAAFPTFENTVAQLCVAVVRDLDSPSEQPLLLREFWAVGALKLTQGIVGATVRRLENIKKPAG